MNNQQIPLCSVLTAPQGDPARRDNVEQQMASAQIEFEFVVGFTPESPEIENAYGKWRNKIFAKRDLTRGEIAVYLGHRKIWQNIIDSGQNSGLVFEDDLSFIDPSNIREVLRAAAASLRSWDLIKLFDFRPHRGLSSFHENGITLQVYKRPNSGMVGYMLTAECCRKLLKRKYIFRAVDEELRYWFEKQIRIVTITPNPVTEISHKLKGSILESSRYDKRRKRNVVRSLYFNIITAYINICCELWSRWIVFSYRRRQS